jgi:hypothetical protein
MPWSSLSKFKKLPNAPRTSDTSDSKRFGAMPSKNNGTVFSPIRLSLGSRRRRLEISTCQDQERSRQTSHRWVDGSQQFQSQGGIEETARRHGGGEPRSYRQKFQNDGSYGNTGIRLVSRGGGAAWICHYDISTIRWSTKSEQQQRFHSDRLTNGYFRKMS